MSLVAVTVQATSTPPHSPSSVRWAVRVVEVVTVVILVRRQWLQVFQVMRVATPLPTLMVEAEAAVRRRSALTAQERQAATVAPGSMSRRSSAEERSTRLEEAEGEALLPLALVARVWVVLGVVMPQVIQRRRTRLRVEEVQRGRVRLVVALVARGLSMSDGGCN